MPYFDELQRKVGRLLEWADARHEQGVKVAPKIARLIKQVQATQRQLEKAAPSAAIRGNEPNDLPCIRAARPDGPRRLWNHFDAGLYAQKVAGAWLARAAGCTLGAPVEGIAVEAMRDLAKHGGADFPPTDYWPAVNFPYTKHYGFDPKEMYTRSKVRYIPVDDDLAYTLLGLLVLEDFGPGFTTEDVGEAWLKYLPLACTAERAALDNLKAGVSWRQAAVKGNPWMEWIGADIRSDPWGYAAPGWPEKAAQFAYRDAYLSHRYNGIYGEMYFSAVIAAAFAVDDPLEACRIGLTEIPCRSRLFQDVAWALRQASKVKDHVHGRGLVDRRFKGMSIVHTNNNACLTIFGLALGGRDVTKVIGNTVAMGMDNDCTGATAGSIVGAVVGLAGVPEHWHKPFGNRCRTYLKGHEWFRNTDIINRFTRVAAKVWQEA